MSKITKLGLGIIAFEGTEHLKNKKVSSLSIFLGKRKYLTFYKKDVTINML